MLLVEGVSVAFGGLQALSNVSVQVPAGAVTGLIGPNGAGKTTLFNAVSGLLHPAAGRIELDGRDLTRLRPAARARLGLARTFQRLEVFGSLTVRDNVRVAAEIRRLWARDGSDPGDVADELLARVGLTEVSDVDADTLPTGTARLVEVARALAARPRALLLDEPSSGLDDRESDRLATLVGGLAAEGLAVLIVEHDVELVMRVSARVAVLERGRLIASGTPQEIRANEAVRAAYLGAGDHAA